jgi:hypothetical protein
MGRHTKVRLLTILLFFPAVLFGQFNNNTTSPYSRFGLGDLQRGSVGRSAAMGGAILGSRSNQQINLANPASFTSVDSLAFLADFGFKADFAQYKNDLSRFSTNNINFSYFAFSFPVTSWLGAGLGLTPYSDTGYDVQMTQEEENFGTVWHRYNGEGSLSRATLGFGIKPLKNISLGVNLYYFFGRLTRNATVAFLDDVDFYTNEKYEQIRLRDFGLSYGLQATLPVNPTNRITLGVTLEARPEFTAFHSDLTRKVLTDGTSTDIDTVVFIDEIRDKIKMPLALGVGLSFTSGEKLEINADYVRQVWSEATFFGESNPFLTDLNRFSVGGEYIPNRYSIRSYFDKVAYRAGFSFENYYLIFGDQQLNDLGISFGVGLPIYRSLSMVNVSAQLGKRGKMSNTLIREYYAHLTVSVNLYDMWFIKRKYD